MMKVWMGDDPGAMVMLCDDIARYHGSLDQIVNHGLDFLLA